MATVMGRPDAVENKRQFYIMAGESQQLDRVRPVLESIGSATFTLGEEPDLANAAKLLSTFSLRQHLSPWLRLSRSSRKTA